MISLNVEEYFFYVKNIKTLETLSMKRENSIEKVMSFLDWPWLKLYT